MAKSLRIELHNAAIEELRNSPPVVTDLVRRGHAIAAAAGDGFEVVVSQSSRTRARVRVQTATIEARIAVARDASVLTSAIGAGR
jgi:hypothetical protein